MRKLKLQVQMTVNGYIAGRNGELDFMEWDWDDELKHYVEGLTESVDCIVLGRKLAEGFIPHWAAKAADPKDPEYASGRMFTDTHKVVFTKTLERSDWNHTDLAKGDLVDEIMQLKEQDGGEIIAYGGAAFVSALIQHGLIDEYHLFINPTALDDGLAIFNQLDNPLKLRLVNTQAFDCGIVVLHYE